jgi:hypothetical protein
MDQLKQLMDYTKFHIGMYTTLCTVLIAILGLDMVKPSAVDLHPYLFGTLLCFAVAGMFGGLVGSSLPYFKTFEEFSQAKLGPWKLKLIPALVCTHLEHTAFWLGIIVVLIGLVRAV